MSPIHKSYLQHETPIAGVINRQQIRGNRSLGYKEVRIHVSDLMKVDSSFKFCEREHVIQKLFTPSVPVTALSASYDLLFALGNSLHDNARERWRRYNKDGDKRVLARWSCPCRNTQHIGVNGVAITCKRCGFPCSVFDEYEVYDPELHIVAHPDFNVVRGKDIIETGVFDKKKHLIRIVEIKGIDRVDVNWYKLDGPLGEHTLQGSFYYHLFKRNGYRVDKVISYLYGDRGLKNTLFTGNPWKEFEVEVSPYERVEKFFNKAKSVLKSIDDKVVPKRTACDKIDCMRAKNCLVASLCFSIPKEQHEKVQSKAARSIKRPKPKSFSV